MNSKVGLKASFLFLFTVFGNKIIASDKAFEVVPKLYEEIGCTEIESNSRTKSFNCPDFTTYDTNKCHLNGRTYNVGDEIEDAESPAGRTDCHCQKRQDETAAHINCAEIECFEDRYRNCITIYDDLSQACPTTEICDQEKIVLLETCEVGGRVYRIGERIYPEYECSECLCTPDYNNATSISDNPNCMKINCGMELDLDDLRKGCVPIYFGTPNCCNMDYKCPSEDDAIESMSNSSDSDGGTCKFGELNFKVGDRLQNQDECSECQCSIPPFLTCIRTC